MAERKRERRWWGLGFGKVGWGRGEVGGMVEAVGSIWEEKRWQRRWVGERRFKWWCRAVGWRESTEHRGGGADSPSVGFGLGRRLPLQAGFGNWLVRFVLARRATLQPKCHMVFTKENASRATFVLVRPPPPT